MESTARLFLLGTFRLEKEGYVVSLATRKVASLLAYLALHPEPHPRETIATLFWGDSSDEHARRSLRTALATLRKRIGHESLLTDRETVQLNPQQALWVDALAFRAQAKELLATNDSTLVVNTDIYQGPLLAGFDDEWIPPERERLRAQYLDVLLHLTQRFRTQGEYPRAIETARRVLAADVANERAQQQIMSCYLTVGDREGALKQYAECRRALRAELAVEPSPETEALLQRIKHMAERRATLETANTNLPIPLTSFIGRTRELAVLKELLGTRRLLTLTGAGGCGKTRLAIQMATDVIGRFSDGVWWVELAAVSDASLLPHVLRRVLGLSEAPGIAVAELLISHLRSKRLLLVLDNCEHLVAACAQLAETILSQCPDVQILATGREMLGLSGEVAWLVPSLSLPMEDVTVSSEAWLQWEGIRLFVERAMAARGDFAVTPVNMSAIARVCRQLDGMPLAIELAAARIKTLSVEQIAARLDDRFHLLTLGSRTALPRQQTLRATMDWSYDLLTEQERVLLRRLSVFAGGWSLEAAEAVCAGDGIEPRQVLDLLSHLADKSLLTVEQRNSESRYRLLETIRQYAREKLLASGEAERIQDCHLNFFLSLAEKAEPRLRSGDQVAWFTRLDVEHGNLRLAQNWSLESSQVLSALRLADALFWFWLLRVHTSEGLERLRGLLLQPEAAGRTLTRARALCAAGHLNWAQAAYAEARLLEEEALSIARELGDKRTMALALHFLGPVNHRLGDLARAQSLLEEGLMLWRGLGDADGIALSLTFLGDVTLDQGDDRRAQLLYEEAAGLLRQLQDRLFLGYQLRRLAQLALVRGENEKAAALCVESLNLNLEAGNKRGIAACLVGLAAAAAAAGRVLGAAKLLGASDAMLESVRARLLPGDQAQYNATLAAVRARLADGAFITTLTEGRGLPVEQVITEALAM